MLTKQNLIDYEIRENGDIYSNINNIILKATDNGHGYKKVAFRNKPFYVHRLVAYVHIPNPKGYIEINHIDGDKSNNHKDNLEWCTRAENRQHAVRLGLWKSPKAMKGKFGKDNPHSKPVIQYDKDWNKIQEFPGVAEAARQIGKKKQAILNMLGGHSKTAHGFRWKYKGIR